MKQTCVGQENEEAGAGALRAWLGVAMGMAGACAMAAQALLELSRLDTPDAAYTAQPPARPVEECGPAPCAAPQAILVKG